jgi:hypothetical protein
VGKRYHYGRDGKYKGYSTDKPENEGCGLVVSWMFVMAVISSFLRGCGFIY